jgi:hypothetical protein
MSDALHVLLLRADGDADAAHLQMVAAIKARLPNLRWVASYRVSGGSVDVVDVVAFQPGEDPAAAVGAAEAVPGVRVELLPARPSAMLAAPGSAPGGAPGGA